MNADLLSFIGVIISLAVLIYLAFKGFNSMIITIIASTVVVVLSKQNIISSFTDSYMKGFGFFVQSYFPVLFISAIFASLMQYTGAMQIIGIWMVGLLKKHVPKKYSKFAAVFILGVILSALLTYGGVNLFVIAFLTLPLGRTVYEELDIPWHLAFCGSLGTATFTMGYLPGTPQIQNLIPMKYLGTTATAGPVIGVIATVITLALGTWYIWYAVRKTELNNEGFYETGSEVIKAMPKINLDIEFTKGDVIRSILPSTAMIVLMLLDVNVLIALMVAIAFVVILFLPLFRNIDVKKMLTEGTNNAVLVTTSVAAIIGFGVVVQSTPGFAYITKALLSIPANPMVQYLIAVQVAAGITGSASGGLGVALGSFGQHYIDLGLDPSAMHRLGAIASCGLDSLPHTSGIFVSLSIARLTHKQAYKHQFWLTVVITVITAVIVTALYLTTGIL